IDDYQKAASVFQLPRMDDMGKQKGYSVPDSRSGLRQTFYLQDHAPSGGLIAQNYARYVHRERNRTTFCSSFTTLRRGDFSIGQHFYIAEYGIRVHGAGNRTVIWKPGDAHGTSLPNID
ncbi:hypothetical protein BJ508DRAFT_199662, partial [Ascobolus immersus RN42]